MEPFDIANIIELNAANNYTYTFTASDKANYSKFQTLTGYDPTITLSDGTHSLTFGNFGIFPLMNNLVSFSGTNAQFTLDGTNCTYMFIY